MSVEEMRKEGYKREDLASFGAGAKVLWRLGKMDLDFVSYWKILGCGGGVIQYVANRGLLAIQLPHITLLQQSNRLSSAFGFSLLSSYWGRQF